MHADFNLVLFIIFPVDSDSAARANLNIDSRPNPCSRLHYTRPLLAWSYNLYICRSTNDINNQTGFPMTDNKRPNPHKTIAAGDNFYSAVNAPYDSARQT
jgi:hypothetical protein